MMGESQNINISTLQAIYNLFGEFRLNLVTNCSSESQFPHFQNEMVDKEFPNHQIQWQQYHPTCCMGQFREKKKTGIFHHKQRSQDLLPPWAAVHRASWWSESSSGCWWWARLCFYDSPCQTRVCDWVWPNLPAQRLVSTSLSYWQTKMSCTTHCIQHGNFLEMLTWEWLSIQF